MHPFSAKMSVFFGYQYVVSRSEYSNVELGLLTQLIHVAPVLVR